MVKASPHIRAMNAGEFSELAQGRVDLERYPASMRRSLNIIITPQGPAICRSGTKFVVPASNSARQSKLVPFIFSNEQAKVLEFADDRIRFIDEDGIQVYAFAAVTVPSTAPFKIAGTGVNALVGDQVVLDGFPVSYNLNGEIANVVAVAGTTFTLDTSWPVGKPVVAGSAALVYNIAADLSDDERNALRDVQSVDVVYLFTGIKRPRKLSRYGAYDWRLENVQFIDGPYLDVNNTTTKLTPSGTGNAVQVMTSDAGPGGTSSASGNRAHIAGTTTTTVPFAGREINYDLPQSFAYYAFDGNDDTYYASDAAQLGNLEYVPAAPFVADGYTIYASIDNRDTTYLPKDFAPSDFVFEGYNGSAWVELDRKESYVLYDASKSVFIPLRNTTAYSKYRLRVLKLVRNGPIEPRVRRLTIRSAAASTFDLTASSVVGINKDVGFLASDVGRLIRIEGSDKAWRPVEIIARVSATVVTVRLLGEPLLDLNPILNWRLGYWSDTTGWPTCGDFFGERLWMGGSAEYPDLLVGSVVGDYENLAPTDSVNVVLDDSAIAVRLNSRRLSRIRWISSDEKGLLVGTGSEEWVLGSGNSQEKNITARNINATPSTRRGSADVDPVKIDRQVLYVQRNGRTLREFAYAYEADGYRSPSMSQLASHLGVPGFREMDYAAEPYSTVWIGRADDSVVGLTYNREESVIGWGRFDFAGALTKSSCVIPQNDQQQDTLWMQTLRVVNGQAKHYIEFLTRSWDFDMTLDEAHFVDCGLRYTGTPVTILYGLQHLEGLEVYGLADQRPVGPFTVTNGSIALDYEASNVVIGLGFSSEGETARLENGAADGTAQGKTKRINNVTPYLWATACGEIGLWNPEHNNEDDTKGAFVYETIEFPHDLRHVDETMLYTGVLPAPIIPDEVNDTRGSIAFRRPKETPLPFNIIALMPQLDTQDR